MQGLAAATSSAGAFGRRLATKGRVRAVRDGLALVGAVVLVLVVLFGPGTDATSYWSFDLAHPYDAASRSLTGTDAFRYAPPLAYLFLPSHALSFDAFRTLWLAVEFGCLVALVRWRWALALVAVYPVALELSSGNIHLPMALGIALGFRFPVAWAFLVLTKITPAVGLLWFALRREWRELGVAIGATLLIAVVSYAAAPDLWAQWVAMLRSDLGLSITADHPHLPVPLWARLPAAVLLVAWGALRDRPWTVAVAVTLALPTIWIQSLPVLLGALPSLARRPAFRWRSAVGRSPSPSRAGRGPA